ASNDAAAEAADLAESEAAPQLWKQIWAEKKWHIGLVTLSLLVLGCVFFFQEQFARRPVFFRRFRTAFLLFSLFYIGWYLQAQLSVVNVLTFTDSLRNGFSWDYFLMDPIVFILWSATAVSLLFWNRGAFCGWLCPFGALQELSNQAAQKLGLKQLKIPFTLHTRLSAVKYVIFMLLFGISLYDLGTAEHYAEIEPFKTAIILKFMREWWWVLFAVALLAAGLFVERFFCRYLCPLGAAMAVPARLRIFDWLRRYHMCGNPCQLCANECPVQAIHPEGDINPNECIQCLNCQVLYHHTTRCPQVVATNKKKAKQAAAKAEAQAAQNEQVVHFVPSARKKTDGAPQD
ncbi:MAG: 4Fe-4S binding protein, partial [Neisseria sp.]|nr:4Fe-4S binding protein [Neisseria sp.]